jgi:hypothetical protein
VLGGSTASTAQLQVNTVTSGTIGEIVKGASSQSADLTQWQKSDGTVLAKVDANGSITGGQVLISPRTYTAAGTTSPQTINQYAGSIRFAAGDSSKVLTNSLVTSTTKVIASIQTNDSTAKSVVGVASSGSVTFYLNAAATAELEVYWELRN